MISLNGRILNDELAAVSPLAPGFTFGAGVFTTVRVRAGRADFLKLHNDRLVHDAKALALPPVTATGELRERCEAYISAAKIADGAVKIIWFADEHEQTTEVIFERSFNYGAETKARGLRLMTTRCASRVARELSRHKTLNYLEHLRAKRAAVSAGFDEALWVDESGVVLEGATTNVFAVINGEIITPSLSFGLLPGVARRVLLNLSSLQQIREARLTSQMLAAAQEVFVTNALMGVMPVCGVDGRRYPVDENDVTRRLMVTFGKEADASH
jgi:branched-subunit amino acid aminotransferase/4-amino-4-deoxychorismate lyase